MKRCRRFKKEYKALICPTNDLENVHICSAGTNLRKCLFPPPSAENRTKEYACSNISFVYSYLYFSFWNFSFQNLILEKISQDESFSLSS